MLWKEKNIMKTKIKINGQFGALRVGWVQLTVFTIRYQITHENFEQNLDPSEGFEQ